MNRDYPLATSPEPMFSDNPARQERRDARMARREVRQSNRESRRADRQLRRNVCRGGMCGGRAKGFAGFN